MSRKITEINLVMQKGTTFAFKFEYLATNGANHPLSLYTIVMKVRKSADSDPVFNISSDDVNDMITVSVAELATIEILSFRYRDSLGI